MRIKCAHCKDYHDSIADVRSCAGIAAPTASAASAPWPSFVPKPASVKQIDTIARMRAERGLTAQAPGTMTGNEASAEITRLYGIPRPKPSGKSFAGMDITDIKEGRYAIEVDGVVKFYKVDKPTEGRWSGYCFVKIQASDDLYPVRGAGAKAVLAAIAVDPQAAMLRYGRELGSCGHCGRTLTNEDSRRLGIGPVCLGKMGGWMDTATVARESDAFNAEWAEAKNVAAREEAEQEAAAFAAKAQRDWYAEMGMPSPLDNCTANDDKPAF